MLSSNRADKATDSPYDFVNWITFKRLAAVLIASRDSAAASKLLLKLNKRNPLDESVIRQLMAVHELAGDKKGLNAVYTDYVRLLSRELGIKPSGDLIYLYDSLVRRISELK